MKFEKMLFSKSVLFSFALVLVVSITLTFFPLIGTLGFEFSATSAVLLSFLSVFVSSSLISSSLLRDRSRKDLSGTIGSIFIINFLLLLLAYVIGLASSVIKEDCFIKEGSIFFVLIPVVSVYFSATLGMLTGYIFGKKGIFIGLLLILVIALYALWHLYHGVSIFVYNPIFGFFPGPLYDEAIPITWTLTISRINIVLWGILLLLVLRITSGFGHNMIKVWDALILIIVAISIVVISTNKPEIGINYSRGYITENILSDSLETENFIIYCAPGTPEANKIELIAMDHEWRYKQLDQFLDVDSSEKITSYIYPDIESRKRISGAGETTVANPIHNEIHLVYDSFPHPILKHELVHVMSGEFGNDLLRLSPKIGLLEGIAVAADWRGQRFTPHQWAKIMYEMEIAPEVKDIVGFGFWYAPSEISYTLMGSFSRYLIDAYGIEKFKKAYKSGDFSEYNKSIDELSLEWKDYLTTIEAPPETKAIAEARFSRPSIFQATCPRKIAQLKNTAYKHFRDDNYFRARENFSDALKLNGSDPNLISWLAYSHYYDGNFDRAIEIAGSSVPKSKIEENMLENIKGNSEWQTGNSEEALRIFNNLRTEQTTDNLTRELEIKISAISQGSIVEESIKEFFATRDEMLQLAYLQEAIKEKPSYAPAYYLKGRLFFNEGEYEKAAPNLIEANLLGLPTESLTNENLRILGISQFANGRYDQAIITFNYLLLLEENDAARQYAKDFIERSTWMKEKEQSEPNQLK